MGYVPTHGDDCYKVRSFPLRCNFCSEKIVYFECSCGSRILLDPPDQGLHSCHGYASDSLSGNSENVRQKLTKIMLGVIEYAQQNPGESPTCPMCDVTIRRQQDFVRHLKRCPKRKEWFPR